MAATMANRGKITACDTSATRLEGAALRLKRAGADNVQRHLWAPGDRWAKPRRPGAGGRALYRTGTWRRNPATAHAAEDLAELVALQHEILEKSAELVRPGGRTADSMLPAHSCRRRMKGRWKLSWRTERALRQSRWKRGWAWFPGNRPRVPGLGWRSLRRRTGPMVLLRGAGTAAMISIRRARPMDARAIGEIHAAVWRSTYAGMHTPYMCRRAVRLAAWRLLYQRAILDRAGGACGLRGGDSGARRCRAQCPRLGTFASGGRARRDVIADGEIETLSIYWMTG